MSNQTADVYTESESHIPNPTDQIGTLDTSGTAGAAHSKLEEVTPVFDVAKAQVAQVAARALDPDDPTPSYMVVTPTVQATAVVDEDAIKERVVAKADALADKATGPVGVTMTPAQEQAAEEGTGAAQTAETQRASQGGTTAGGTPTQVQPTSSQTQPPASASS